MEKVVERWGCFEVALKGPSEGNPFLEHEVKGRFCGREESVCCEGFYDGEGIYRVRFMPSFEGEYDYEIEADFLEEPLLGNMLVTAPREGNHGPVRVTGKHHFAYEDGTSYYPVGTTCYVWNLQGEELMKETLASLKSAGFNKLRFCTLPKHFDYNLHEPSSYPYEGTPMDSLVLTNDNYYDYTGDKGGNHFDKLRLNPEHFRQIERCILSLQELGIEADLILMHPYDRWGFSQMSRREDELYWRYCIARFAAFRTVWWSLANEYDLLHEKSLLDWEFYAGLLVEKDPYRHLRSIHHCVYPYDYSRPWVTHCSLQCPAEEASSYRMRYGKPVVVDEMTYEGNLPWPWGNISGEEMVRRFWAVTIQGAYPGHGETYLGHKGNLGGRAADILWWSHGGKLYGESYKRVRFLHAFLSETPGLGLSPDRDMFNVPMASPEGEGADPKSCYVLYFGIMQPAEAVVEINKDTPYRVERIDTWNMTIEDMGVHFGRFHIPMPGRQYMALRLIREEKE